MKRRDFLKFSLTASATSVTAGVVGSGVLFNKAHAAKLGVTLSDPATQDMFTQIAVNALDPNFKYTANPGNVFNVSMQQTVQMTGLKNASGTPLSTTIWGYSEKGKQASWPGKTFEVQSNQTITVNWLNDLTDALGNPLPHILPVDESLHWCYSLSGYEGVSIATDGVPLVPHVHGGHSDPAVDGNPEYFTGTTTASRGPRWVSDSFVYDNSQSAGTLWYHDHALGVTRLNVYAGLAGFYIIRDNMDTGKHGNPLQLPAEQYELAYAVQDRMFKDNGDLFYPAFEGDPAWDDFITGEGATPPIPGGPSALAEFFGDHIVVNGKLWPKTNVEPRNYRMRFLNGCDSRFMRLRFRVVPAGDIDFTNASAPLDFLVVGTDQGLLTASARVTEVDFLPGERLDIVFNFGAEAIPADSRIIVENILGDSPFGGDLPGPDDLYPNRRTDRIMAFDVIKPLNPGVPDNFPGEMQGTFEGVPQDAIRTRKLGLYEGTDQHGRLMPMLGTAEPVTDVSGNAVDGSMMWGAPITENPGLGDTEVWEIYNDTGDAHPIHVHLVHFEIIRRNKFTATEVNIPVKTHDGSIGNGFRLENIVIGAKQRVLNTEQGPKDVVLCYPGEVTIIKMKFDKPGRYVWHCHILSHEDHEMMRPFHVGPGPF
jgi:FtsP/CotA-like multicopper oxidase with cupredoxin domain